MFYIWCEIDEMSYLCFKDLCMLLRLLLSDIEFHVLIMSLD